MYIFDSVGMSTGSELAQVLQEDGSLDVDVRFPEMEGDPDPSYACRINVSLKAYRLVTPVGIVVTSRCGLSDPTRRPRAFLYYGGGSLPDEDYILGSREQALAVYRRVVEIMKGLQEAAT